MVEVNALSFTDWLRQNTALTESSIALYVRTINAFCVQYKELTVANLNAYISRSVRSKNCSYMKYAFKHYLTFLGHDEAMYKSLLKVKIPPRKKMGMYRDPHIVREIISLIDHERHRDKAMLQFAVGSRARGIITLHDSHIDLNYEPDVIRLNLIEKGEREQEVYLHRSFEELLRRYMGNGFLFLPKTANLADEQDLERYINNERTYYFTALSDAARSIGIDRFGTHDLRRNAIDDWDKHDAGDTVIQQGAGHSDKRMTERYIGRRRTEVKDMMIKHQGYKNVTDQKK
jgi:integrase